MTSRCSSAPLHNDTAQNAIARKVEIQSTYYSHAIDIGRFAPWDEKEISETDDLIRQFGRESIYPGGSWNSDDFVYGNFMTLQEARPITRRFTFQLILEALTQLKSAIEANGGKGGLVTVYDILSDGSKVKSALGSYWQSDYPVSYANSSAS